MSAFHPVADVERKQQRAEMSSIRAHPWRVLIVAIALIIAACLGSVYMMLVVNVSDGAGRTTALIMLAGSALTALSALVVFSLSVRAILADL